MFTEPAPTATGRRLALRDELMPRNRAGKPIDAADYNFSDGFSPGQAIITRVPGLDTLEAFRRNDLPPIDDPARSLRADSRVAVINARTGRRHLVWAEIDLNPENRADRNLIIRPARNFDEGERYIVALTDLRRAGGGRIGASPAFRKMRDRKARERRARDRRMRERRRRRARVPAYAGQAGGSRARDMEAIFRTLERAGISREDVYRAWDFTVASAPSTTGRMLSIRDRAFDELGDANLADRVVEGSSPRFTINTDVPDSSPVSALLGASPVGIPADGVSDHADGPLVRQVRGRVLVPCFLDTPGCAPGSQFRYAPGSSGLEPLRVPGNTAAYDFTCNVPRHPGPLRPALYGHGLLGSQGEINQEQLKALGQEHGFLFCAVDWNGMSTKDLPTIAQILQDVSRFPALTDHVQQGYLGFLFLGRAMLHGEGLFAHPAFAGIDVDRRELYYDGNSQGGIYGGALTAVSPDIRRAVLGVPGMNYSTLLRRSVDFDLYANGNVGTDTPVGLYDNYPDELERPLLLGLIQMLWDRSDPNGYAHHMTSQPLPDTPAHEVLLHVGFGDHQVADVTTEVEARTIGARVHRPLLQQGRDRFRDRPYPDRPAGPSFFDVESLGPPGYSAAGSGVVFWDIGPVRTVDGRSRGTPPPPAGNVPPREGSDPHEDPRRSEAGRRQKSAFLRPDGRIVDVCGGPCFAGGWTGSGR